jgi:hypothetical protein
MMIDVVSVRPLGGFRLEIEFSNDMIGERDFSFLMRRESGPMLDPLKEPPTSRAC